MSVPRGRWADCLPPFVLFVLSAGFVVIGLGYPQASRLVPELIGGAMLVLTALDVLSRTPTLVGRTVVRWLNPAALVDAAERSSATSRARQLVAMLGAVAFAAALVWFGVLWTVPVFVLLAIRFGAARSWLFSIAVAAITTGLIWALFTPLLGLDLWPGILFGGEW